MTRFCANCGTEVDETAAFCPTCGQPIDQADEMEMPPAPAWPDPAPTDDPVPASPWRPDASREPEGDLVREARADDPAREPVREPRFEDPTRVEPKAPPPAPAAAAGAPPPPARPAAPAVNVPVTLPVTLSAWLIGGGAMLGAIGAIIGLFGGFLNPVDVLLAILLVGIAATVFFAANVPAIPHLRLATMAVALVGFGIALDRIGFGVAGVGELLLFLGTAAAAMGCIILELGRDQPLGGPRT